MSYIHRDSTISTKIRHIHLLSGLNRLFLILLFCFSVDFPTSFAILPKKDVCVPGRKKSGVMIGFEWDVTKAKKNLRKHGVDFSEAATVFKDRLSITIYDPGHSVEEDRYITVGTSVAGRFLMVAHADRGNRTRIVSARELTRKERKAYESEIQKRKS
jgi:hypothetical protein